MTNASSGPGVSRRQALTRIGALGAGATAVAATRTRGFAQPKVPITLSFWTFDNPQQRPWLHKRVDRKSTRLNSSHTVISYAVFCLKKKKENKADRHMSIPLILRCISSDGTPETPP